MAKDKSNIGMLKTVTTSFRLNMINGLNTMSTFATTASWFTYSHTLTHSQALKCTHTHHAWEGHFSTSIRGKNLRKSYSGNGGQFFIPKIKTASTIIAKKKTSFDSGASFSQDAEIQLSVGKDRRPVWYHFWEILAHWVITCVVFGHHAKGYLIR